MSVMETILIFVVIPVVIYGVLGLLTMRSKLTSTTRYRPGQEWEHSPVWWMANPAGVGESGAHGSGDPAGSAEPAIPRGGARGSW